MGSYMKMMNIPLALKELGIRPVLFNAIYRLKILSGYYRLTTPPASYTDWNKYFTAEKKEPDFITALLSASRPDEATGRQIIAAADEIVQGTIQLYGAIPTQFQFKTRFHSHWTNYASGRVDAGTADIKDVWEPARFSWACILSQAYLLSRDEKYPAFFWEQLELFLENNPPNIGPHWMNGQEVALRLIAFTVAWQAFRDSPKSTTEHTEHLRSALAAHAQRISASLVYARSQHNNHLLSEAAGLYTAALLLPGLPRANYWKQTSWNLLIEAWRDQIAPDGSYIQQSVNYHRLMLQLAIWVQTLSNLEGAKSLPVDVKEKIVLAIHWLEKLILSDDGRVPNMGSNDGANILPLGGVAVSDYRPVVKLARQLFPSPTRKPNASIVTAPQQVIVMKDGNQVACMRTARYHGRPSHADQLHLDLWWNNWNIALDAGTYRYNHASPWANALAGTANHNTITLNGMDQMIRAGRFLWIQKANIHNLDIQRDSARHIQSISAEQDGYRKFGAIQARRVTSRPGDKPGWLIQDDILPSDGIPTASKFITRLVWLLPDWEWEAEGRSFRLITPSGIIRLDFAASGVDEQTAGVEIFRAGESLTASKQTNPTWGWYSPTYGVKEPALAVHFQAEGTLPLQLTTHWRLPG
jgi:hypothetical protein